MGTRTRHLVRHDVDVDECRDLAVLPTMANERAAPSGTCRDLSLESVWSIWWSTRHFVVRDVARRADCVRWHRAVTATIYGLLVSHKDTMVSS